MTYESEMNRRLRSVDRARAAVGRRKRFLRRCWQMIFGGALALVVGTWFGAFAFGVTLAVIGGLAMAGALFTMAISAMERDSAYNFSHEDDLLAEAEADLADWFRRMEETR